VSPHYDQYLSSSDHTGIPTAIGVRFPWLDGYQPFSGDTVYPGPGSGPNSIFLRQSNLAPDGSTKYPRGAISFDHPPSQVRRSYNYLLTMRDEGIVVPAGGTRSVHQHFVMGTTQAEVTAKATANEDRYTPYRTDGMLKKSGGSYVGNNVYNTTGASQTVLAKVLRGRKATFFVKVQNDGRVADSFRILGPGGKPGFAVRYLAGASGSNEITGAVKAGTYTLGNLAPGQTRVFRLVVKVKAGATVGALRTWLVRATSTHRASRLDVVAAKVRVRRG
jgi:hypothetical protein